MSNDERTRVEVAIRDAEVRAGADFVCVLQRRADDYVVFPLAWASLVAFATPWVLLWATAWAFATILLVQLAMFGLSLVVFSVAPIRRRLVPRRLQRAAAHRAAAEQFLIRDLATTSDRRGVLLFVSVDERYARVLADDGALAGVPDGCWREAVDRLIADARRGRHVAGFAAALAHCSDALSATAPATRAARPSRLPDRFIVLD